MNKADRDALNARKEFQLRLTTLWEAAGRPSSRKMSDLTDGAMSHGTTYNILAGKGWPSWTYAEKLVQALGGDASQFKPIWDQGDRLNPIKQVVPTQPKPGGGEVKVMPGEAKLREQVAALTERVEWLEAVVEELRGPRGARKR